ncbi:MAG: orotate phosphoribosyltransferase [Candidatus Lutacidiplasmatales archaeon]
MSRTASEAQDVRTALAQRILELGAVRFGSFTLTSGAHSDVYVDIKRAWTDPDCLSMIAQALAPRVADEPRLAGMELGAVPIVVALALTTRKPYVVLRKAAKEHGTKQPFEGEVPAGSRFVLIEDVTSTGGSAVRSVEILRAAGAVVDRTLSVVDREMGAREALAHVGVRLDSLLALSELRGARA